MIKLKTIAASAAALTLMASSAMAESLMFSQHLPLSEQALELIAHRFKLLSEPSRLRLLQLLMQL